jgi:transketolase
MARELIVRMANKSKSGHIGGAMSCIDILVVLYSNFFKKDIDHFIMSKGHACMAYYAILAIEGIIPIEWLDSYHINGGKLSGHPINSVPGIEWSSGSLGHGLSIAAGFSIAKKLNKDPGTVYVLLGDGECNEGSIWEAALLVSQQRLNNLVAIVDCNKHQGMDRCVNIDPNGNLLSKWEAFGWKTMTVNGHDIVDLEKIFLNEFDCPTVILADTIKGKGISFLEDTTESHYRFPKDEEMGQIIGEINNA